MKVRQVAPLCALLAAGCIVDRQTYHRHPDGSYTATVSLTTFAVRASAVGMRSEWTAEASGMIYGDSITNVVTEPSAELAEAVAAGVVKGLMSTP